MIHGICYQTSLRFMKRQFFPIQRISRQLSVFKYLEKNTTKHVLSVYDIKAESYRHIYDRFNDSIHNVNSDFHPVVLTARPDEFEKLPPKCSSCGAILQSELQGHVGFVPKKKFLEELKGGTLNKLSCTNCFQLRAYNKNIVKRISNGEVISQLKHLRQQKALILYIVDMQDIEGTMVKHLNQIIGKKKRVIIVGNKVDKLPQDDSKASKQLEHMKDILKEQCYRYSLEQDCNFRDICLVSGKTGFGFQSLVDKIQKHRDMDMDVYLVGCANTGKSTLYNLIANLLNVHKDEALPPQGIIHHLPGTTNSLIRHDISLRRMMRMQKRLKSDPWDLTPEVSTDEDFYNFITQKEYKSLEKLHAEDKMERKLLNTYQESAIEPLKVELVDDDYLAAKKKRKKQNFLYDTPGIFNDSQIVRYLNSSEINYLSPQKWIVPRTFLMKPGGCLFIGGFARLDYLEIKQPTNEEVQDESSDEVQDESSDEVLQSAQPMYVTLMISPNVPAHVTVHETADEKYKHLFVNNFFKIPEGSRERLENFPPLKPIEYNVVGQNRNINCCDIALHGIGWLSISATAGSRVKIAMHTPHGEGQTLREKPLLPYTVRKKESRGVPYYGHVNQNMYSSSRRKSPQFVRLFQHQNQPVYAWKAKIREKVKVERLREKEEKRVKRLKEGVLLGRMKRLAEKEIELNAIEYVNTPKLSEKR